ncbi:recombinase family protein [Yersinia pseudotuberculosis]|uniref:recombinase family protein n=1 Tax=Yersinia pseudotuberculosis TaxID=633 RepID=UPI0005DE4676|nr:recombinase family protein [Yersinia pseudotuberculosis]CNL05058.1 Recombinase [Yersinia pseudotuberculosis]
MSRQQKLLLAYVENYQDPKKLGYELSTKNFQWMLQPGQSAFKGFNLEVGELHDFIKEAMTGKHQGVCLIIENIDRFSRATPSKSAFNFLALVNNGIHIHEVETGEIYTEDLNLDQLSSSVTRSNRESARKAFLSNANWNNRYEEALAGSSVLTKRVPKWMIVENDQYVLNTAASTIITYIFDQFIKGMGSTSIARELNKAERFIGGVLWYPQNLNKLLSDPRVCGWLTPKNNTTRCRSRLYPQIISDEQYQRVQNIKESKNQLVKHKPSEKMNNLFNGISTCKKCGSSMSVVKQSYKGELKYFRLFCAKRKELKTCDATSIRYDFIEVAIFEFIQNFDWNSVMDSQDTFKEDSLKQELITKNEYVTELRIIIDSSSAPDLSIIRTLDKANKELLNLQSKISSIIEKPINIDLSKFDINNTEDRTKYNLTLRKVVTKIEIQRYNSYVMIQFHYYSGIKKHTLLMESLTGKVRSNITKTESNNIHLYESNFTWVQHNTETDEVIISDDYFSEAMAFLILFMEQDNTSPRVIEKLRRL